MKILVSILLLSSLVSADNNVGGDDYYRGVAQSVSEYGKIQYVRLKRYALILDGKKISSDDLLFLKGVGKRMNIPNVRFINNRFLVFGDYSRSADAFKAKKRLRSVFKDDVLLRVAESEIFGQQVAVTPILVGALRDGNNGYSENSVYISDSSKYERRTYESIPAGEVRNSTNFNKGSAEVEEFTYDNSSWDNVVGKKENTTSENTLDKIKKAHVVRGKIFIEGNVVRVGENIYGYKIESVNAADNSFLVKNLNDNSLFLIDNNIAIKM